MDSQTDSRENAIQALGVPHTDIRRLESPVAWTRRNARDLHRQVVHDGSRFSEALKGEWTKRQKVESHLCRRKHVPHARPFAVPLLCKWRDRPQLHATFALAPYHLWSTPVPDGTDHRQYMEKRISSLETCDCRRMRLRRLLCPEKERRTRELLPLLNRDRPWRYILHEAWNTGVPPWETAPDHQELQDWQELVAYTQNRPKARLRRLGKRSSIGYKRHQPWKGRHLPKKSDIDGKS